MQSTSLRKTAAIAIAATALLHVYVGLIELEEYFGSVRLGELRYIGALFLIGSAGGFMVAVQLWRGHDVAAWVIGALIAGGMAGGFILSRTTGLPNFDERGKWELVGLVSLALEGVYLAAFAAWASARSRARVAAPQAAAVDAVTVRT
jgi:hypothetical protein